MDQTLWPTTEEEKVTYTPGNIKKLCSTFNIQYDMNLQKEFNKLVKNILDNNFFCDNKKSESLLFWSRTLQYYGQDMSPSLKRLIRSAIITPFGSAEVERGLVKKVELILYQ